MTISTKTGTAIATAAALLFGTLTAQASSTPDASTAKVHCEGVNACKGHSACKTASNQCKGMNACKGHGFVEMTAEECAAAKEKTEDHH